MRRETPRFDGNEPRDGRGRRWLAVPPWLLSLLLHAGLLVVLGATLHLETTRSGGPATRTAEVGIALKHQDGPREYFTSQADADGPASSKTAITAAALSRQDVLADHSPADPSRVLPAAPAAIGLEALGGEGVGDAGAAARGPRGGSGGTGSALGKGQARLNVFGTQGQGYKFVYVFDRSGSMGGVGRSALEAAKAELLASLEGLDRNHQFQIIFYNQQPWPFNPSGEPGRLAFGTDRNKELARRFVGGITADGGTRHEDALLMAIKMRPDVIFFLTDADEPRLSNDELEKIAQRAAGITINAIEFGFGPQQDRDNFLVRLARLCGGQHAYVDVSQIGANRRP